MTEQLEEINFSYSSVMEELRELETLRRSNSTLHINGTPLPLTDLSSELMDETEFTGTESDDPSCLESTDWDSMDVMQTTTEGSAGMTSYCIGDLVVYENLPAVNNAVENMQLPGCCDSSQYLEETGPKRSSLTPLALSISTCSSSTMNQSRPTRGCCLPIKKRYLSVRRKMRSIRHLLKLRMTGRVLAVL